MLLLMALDTLLTLIFLGLLAWGGKRYAPYTNALKNPFRGLFAVGFGVLEVCGFHTAGRGAARALRNYRIVYGEKYGEFYHRAALAREITLAWLTLLAGLSLSVLARKPALSLLAAVVAAAVVWYDQSLVTEQIRRREESMLSEYPEVLSKLALLMNAGMIMSEAWQKIAETGDGCIYEEMRRTVEDLRNGMNAKEAYLDFAARCGVDVIRKFISTLMQNMDRGNRELVLYLTQYSQEAWNDKKQRALQKGQAASSKLVLPLGLMFIGLLIMICVPIFAGIGG